MRQVIGRFAKSKEDRKSAPFRVDHPTRFSDSGELRQFGGNRLSGNPVRALMPWAPFGRLCESSLSASLRFASLRSGCKSRSSRRLVTKGGEKGRLAELSGLLWRHCPDEGGLKFDFRLNETEVR